MTRPASLVLLAVVAACTVSAADTTAKKAPKAALQAFQDLIGEWNGTGLPKQGTKEERDKNFWTETIGWTWQFKGDDAWLKVAIDKGKYFTGGELRYLPDTDRYKLTLKTTAKESLTFEGELKEKRLILERTDDGKKETQRLTFSLLHDNRHLYTFEVKGADQVRFAPVYQVGATRAGVAFAAPSGKPECVVSGGLGTMPVMHKGKTYYVCCSGCRDAFNDTPEKYIKAFEEQQKQKK